MVQLTVVRRLFELIREDLLQERQQRHSLRGLTQHFGRHLILELLDPLKLRLIKLLLIHVVVLAAALLRKEGQVTVY